MKLVLGSYGILNLTVPGDRDDSRGCGDSL
jgi:hypothetical protein